MDDEISAEQKRLQTCSITGKLNVEFYNGGDGAPVATIYGAPDGLRSLAAILNVLADLEQQCIPLRNPPVGEGFHQHLTQGHGLAQGSLRLDLGRADPRSGSNDEKSDV